MIKKFTPEEFALYLSKSELKEEFDDLRKMLQKAIELTNSTIVKVNNRFDLVSNEYLGVENE